MACGRAPAEAFTVERPDPLRIVEAAYTWEASDSAWLERVVDAAAPFSIGGGVVGVTFTSAPGVRVAESAGAGATDRNIDGVRRFCEAIPAAHASSILAPTEFAGNAAWRLERLARATHASVAQLTNGVPPPPSWGVIGGAPQEKGILLGFLAGARTQVHSSDPFPGGHGRVLGLVGAHLSAALRLRARGPAPSDPVNDVRTEAVLSPRGRVLHAQGDARSNRARESLSEAVLRAERARGRLRRVDSEQAMHVWAALVSGRWSIIEATERDGKRFLLARKNPPGSPDILALTKRENDVIWLAVQGHSHKYIAYELGISVAVVVRHLNGAMRKLRVATRRELLRKLGLAFH